MSTINGLTPVEIRLLQIANNVYAFIPLPEDGDDADALVKRGFLKINSDRAYKITQSGKSAFKGFAIGVAISVLTKRATGDDND